MEKILGSYPLEVASILQGYLGPFVRQAGLGRSILELIIRIDARTQYRPDLSFISHEKWPVRLRAPRKGPWDIAPERVVEVVIETDRAWRDPEKVRDYFKAGSQVVWIIDPNLEVVHVYDSSHRVVVLGRGDILDGGAVIPGFRLPLATLFQGEPAEEDAANLAD